MERRKQQREYKLTLLSINDVYEIEPTEGVGGFSPLYSLVQQQRCKTKCRGGRSLFFVCGDFMSASRLAEPYKGSHMVHLFNEMGVDYVVFGNHEFDFGNDICKQRIKESKFTWLGTNVLGLNGQAFGGSKWIDVIELDYTDEDASDTEMQKWNDSDDGKLRVGLLGLCTLSTPTLSFPGEDVQFAPVIPCAQQAVKCLIEEHNVDVVIAITHVSLAQDKELAAKVPQIDVVLGGHDHVPYCLFENKNLIFKCGQNADHLGRVDLTIIKNRTSASMPSQNSSSHHSAKKQSEIHLSWKMILNRGAEHNERIDDIIHSYCRQYDEAMKVPIGRVETSLDSTGTRCMESTMANMLTDAIRDFYDADVCIINGGFIRGNRLYGQGHILTLGDIHREFPFPKHCVMIELKGEYIWDTLEAGVRAVEERAGFFLHVSKGWGYSYDVSQPPGKRVVSVKRDGQEIDKQQTYRVVVTEYMYGGGDGFVALRKGKHIRKPAQDALIINEIIARHITHSWKATVHPVLQGRVVCIS